MNPVLTYLNEAIEALTKAGIETPRLDAEILLAHALDCERFELYAATTRYLLPYGQLEEFENCVERRIKNEPVAYIVGYKEFWSLKIKVTPAVLIPRPATEKLVEKVLKLLDQEQGARNKELAILDLCTGSGAIAAALAKELPTAKIVATDISETALEIAKENLKFAGNRITFIQSNLFKNVEGKFDWIVSNPPYIPSCVIPTLDPDVTNYEPHLALDGGRDGLDFVRRIGQDAINFLKENGWLILENGASGLKVETVSAAELTSAARKGCGGMGPY